MKLDGDWERVWRPVSSGSLRGGRELATAATMADRLAAVAAVAIACCGW